MMVVIIFWGNNALVVNIFCGFFVLWPVSTLGCVGVGVGRFRVLGTDPDPTTHVNGIYIYQPTRHVSAHGLILPGGVRGAAPFPRHAELVDAVLQPRHALRLAHLLDELGL